MDDEISPCFITTSGDFLAVTAAFAVVAVVVAIAVAVAVAIAIAAPVVLVVEDGAGVGNRGSVGTWVGSLVTRAGVKSTAAVPVVGFVFAGPVFVGTSSVFASTLAGAIVASPVVAGTVFVFAGAVFAGSFTGSFAGSFVVDPVETGPISTGTAFAGAIVGAADDIFDTGGVEDLKTGCATEAEMPTPGEAIVVGASMFFVFSGTKLFIDEGASIIFEVAL